MAAQKTVITLSQILNLVGNLDDSPGINASRERFRAFLRDNVQEIGQVRDYIEESLRLTGDQYNRAFQDLVNHVGMLLGFNVTFGRYHGVTGEIGFDGHWKSPSGSDIVVEVKTTETYAIKTVKLVGYIDELISAKRIPSWDKALGLYVVGRPDPEIDQLGNAIIAEKRTDQLRIISAESLLSLAEAMYEYDVSHEDVLAILLPSGPKVDPIVGLMSRLIAQPPPEETPIGGPKVEEPLAMGEVGYWMTPVRSEAAQSAEQVVTTLVKEEQIYAFGERTPGRRHIKPGDWLCFHASGKGVIAHAKVLSKPEKKPHPKVSHPEEYPWVFRVGEAELYLNNPIVIDAAVRSKLDAFKTGDPNKPWGWFVQATRRISANDFQVITGR